jgi:hypothetical protein
MSKKFIATVLVTLTTLTGFSTLITAAASASPRFIVDFNVDRGGEDYRKFETNSMESCLRACATESQCKSFTHVPPSAQPGISNPEGICWLKSGVPAASNNPGGMISGVKK